MLQIIVREDKGLTLVSDDANTENVRVADLFEGEMVEDEGDYYNDPQVSQAVIDAWDAGVFDETLIVDFEPKYTKEILEALTAEFGEADELLEKLFPSVRHPKRSKK